MGFNVFIALLKANLLKAATGLVGWRASVALFVINWACNVALYWAQYLDITIEVKKEVAEKLKDYQEKINAPDASADDVNDAFDDFIN